MKALFFEPTEDSPKIFLDPDSGRLLVEGRSFMEDTTPFHQAIISWLRNYFQEPQKSTVLELEIDYLNTSSTKMLIDILFELNKFYIFGNEVTVVWRYYQQDEDMEDLGHELEEMVDVPFQFGVLV
ncbi:DUF1987 domain-containing protein [Fulvivirga imtechensis]|nr:DUF1987 domain-containing protein [Fulvivirga imtechensis]